MTIVGLKNLKNDTNLVNFKHIFETQKGLMDVAYRLQLPYLPMKNSLEYLK